MAIKSHGLKWLHIFWSTALHFGRDDCRQHAAALTYTTLFAMVPLLTVIFTVLASLPSLAPIRLEIETYVFTNLMPSSGASLQSYLQDFANKAANLTILGIGMLFVTSLFMLMSVEAAFNKLWQVSNPRSNLSAMLRYWAVLSLGPVLFGVGIAFSSYLTTLRIFSDSAVTFAPTVIAIPLIFTTLCFSFLYVTVPNCRVPWRAGLMGGLVAAILFELSKKLFGIFVTHFASYEVIYGAFAAFPIFLLWVYLSWLIILFGVQLTRSLAFDEEPSRGNRHPLLALMSLLALLQARHRQGLGVSEVEAMRTVGRQHVAEWGVVSSWLHKHQFIRYSRNGELLLGRDLSQLSVAQLLTMVPWALPTAADLASYPTEPWLPLFAQHCHPLHQAIDESLSDDLGKLLAAELS